MTAAAAIIHFRFAAAGERKHLRRQPSKASMEEQVIEALAACLATQMWIIDAELLSGEHAGATTYLRESVTVWT